MSYQLVLIILCLLEASAKLKEFSHEKNLSLPNNVIILSVGEKKNLSVSDTSSLRVSSAKRVRILAQSKKNLVILGRSPGKVLLSSTKEIFRIEVLSTSVGLAYQKLLKKIQFMKGLYLEANENQITVQGTLLRLSDWVKLATTPFAEDFRWQFQAQILPELIAPSLEHLRNLASQAKLPTPMIHLEPNPSVEIPKDGPHSFRLKQIYQAYGLPIENQSQTWLATSSVRLQLSFVELQNGSTRQLGLNWTDGQEIQLLPKLNGPQDLKVSLNYLANQGQARILATPTLVARSGAEAEFLAGGEFAVRTKSMYRQEVNWKRHGLWLKFKPELDLKNHVRLSLETELSIPDYSSSIEGVPSLKTSKTQAQVDMSLGKTLVLTEIVRVWNGSSQAGVAGLMNIPIIGSLFSSHDFIQQKSKLVLFITPELIDVDISEQPKLDEENNESP
ncbi:MAG: type II and III secretion system protein [Bdellovibrionales bacterium]|nr:type II and III secretion system protein [Bdellovibrionales bacterium]